MTFDELRRRCNDKPDAIETFPFDEETLVFKVGGKMFALVNVNGRPPRVNLKCDPGLARDLRSGYSSIIPGYHMNKEHWNTVILDGEVPDETVGWLVDHSYDLVRRAKAGRTRDRSPGGQGPTTHSTNR